MEFKKLFNKRKRGITLISLVVTIIVMLILAGITINLTIGQDGILKRSEEAGKNYINAADYERNQLAEFLNETDNIIANVIGEKDEHKPTTDAPEIIEKTETTLKILYKQSDEKSGIKEKKVRLTDSTGKNSLAGYDWVTITNDEYTFTLTSDMDYYVQTYAKDGAGNESYSEITLAYAEKRILYNKNTGFTEYLKGFVSENSVTENYEKSEYSVSNNGIYIRMYKGNYEKENSYFRVVSTSAVEIPEVYNNLVIVYSGSLYKNDGKTSLSMQGAIEGHRRSWG